MSAHVGWISSRKEIPLGLAARGLQASESLACQNGDSRLYYGDGRFGVISFVYQGCGPRVGSSDKRARFFPAGDGLVMGKGLIENQGSIVDWFTDLGLADVATRLCVVHGTRAYEIDEKMIVPGAAIIHKGVVGAPIGEIIEYVTEELGRDSKTADVEYDSAAVFVEYVANLVGSLGLGAALSCVASTSKGLYCSFVDIGTNRIGLLDTGEAGQPESRMHFALEHDLAIIANEACSIKEVQPNARIRSLAGRRTLLLGIA